MGVWGEWGEKEQCKQMGKGEGGITLTYRGCLVESPPGVDSFNPSRLRDSLVYPAKCIHENWWPTVSGPYFDQIFKLSRENYIITCYKSKEEVLLY